MKSKKEYKLNIRPENCKFAVHKDHRRIICTIENTSDLFLDFASENFKIPYFSTDLYNNSKLLSHELIMPNSFKGVAICNPDDEWNEEIGKLIAYSRAKDNLNKSFFKRANLYINTLDKYLDDSVNLLNRVGDRLTISTERRHNKIISLVGEEDGLPTD